MNPVGCNIAEAPGHVLAGQLDLDRAWERVRAKAGMPGVDGISTGRFGRCAAACLRSLTRQLAEDTYRPWPLRVAELPKKDGSSRLLLVPAVGDRVLQSAVAQWIGQRWNPCFHPSSFAYRAGRGVRDAYRALAAYRDAGWTWALDADIERFFDSVEYETLLGTLGEWLGQGSPLLGWLRRWVKAAVWDGDDVGRLTRGIPQGSPLSPVLANIHLHAVDEALAAEGIPFVRYADDMVLLARTPFGAQQARAVLEAALAGRGLALRAAKTRIVSFAQGFSFLGAELDSGRVLIPFEKKKTPRKAVFVAPVMPVSLRVAYRRGELEPRAWEWRPKPGAAAAGENRRWPSRSVSLGALRRLPQERSAG